MKKTNEEILTSLSELIRSLSRIANNYPKVMYKDDMENLQKAKDILSSNTEINENEIPKGSKLSHEELLYDNNVIFDLKDAQILPNVLEAMSQAVQQREEEIKEWISEHMTFDRLKSMKMVDTFELLQFLNQKP